MSTRGSKVMKHNKKRRSFARFGRPLIMAAGLIAAVFVLANAGVWLLYHGRALPNTHLGRSNISGMSLNSLNSISARDILPEELSFVSSAKAIRKTPAVLGFDINVPASLQSLRSNRRWLPILSYFNKYYVPLSPRVDESRYVTATADLNVSLGSPAIGQHIAFQNSAFYIAPKQNGYSVDAAQLKTNILAALTTNKSPIAVPMNITLAKETPGLAASLQSLQQQLATALTFKYADQKLQPSKADIGSWFTPSGQSMVVAEPRVAGYLAKSAKSMGITIANQSDLAKATSYAIAKNQPLTLAIVPAGDKTAVRTYCTAARGVDNSVLAELEGKLAATYADTRGWNNEGKVAFQHVSNDCQYTVWMSAAAKLASFGSVCDEYYNCQVGTNVIMNYDRWTTATPPWTNAKGNLEDYRALMIDHETGHRLGFYDNPTCPAAGSPAPVMMQQSVDLKGCAFNIWPTPPEFTQLNALLGL